MLNYHHSMPADFALILSRYGFKQARYIKLTLTTTAVACDANNSVLAKIRKKHHKPQSVWLITYTEWSI